MVIVSPRQWGRCATLTKAMASGDRRRVLESSRFGVNAAPASLAKKVQKANDRTVTKDAESPWFLLAVWYLTPDSARNRESVGGALAKTSEGVKPSCVWAPMWQRVCVCVHTSRLALPASFWYRALDRSAANARRFTAMLARTLARGRSQSVGQAVVQACACRSGTQRHRTRVAESWRARGRQAVRQGRKQ